MNVFLLDSYISTGLISSSLVVNVFGNTKSSVASSKTSVSESPLKNSRTIYTILLV